MRKISVIAARNACAVKPALAAKRAANVTKPVIAAAIMEKKRKW
jgi:hypothetical protein